MGLTTNPESIVDSPPGKAQLLGTARRFLALAALTAGLLLAPAGGDPVAAAGEYQVWSCRGPDGSPISAGAWRLRAWNDAPGDFTLSGNCVAGGWIGAAAADTGLTPSSQAWATFDLPRGGEITGYRIWRYLSTPPLPGTGYVAAVRDSDAGSITERGCASSQIVPLYTCFVSGTTADPLDPSNEYARAGVSLDRLDLYTGCLTGTCPPTSPIDGPEMRIYRSVVQIADDAAPVVSSIGGTAVTAEPINGPASLTVTASDSGGGLRSISLRIDGQPVASGPPAGSPATCAVPYSIPRPCLAGGSRSFTFDTRNMSAGAHHASGTVTDAAGNSTDWGPLWFTVAETVAPTPDPDNGSPATVSPRLRFDRSLVDHRAARNAVLRGRLTTDSGAPVAGATLTARLATIPAGKAERDLAPVRTGPDGRFAVRVRGAGAKRVTVSYAPHVGGAPVASAAATARSRIALSLRPRPKRVRRGRVVRFRGRVTGVGAAAGGANLEIQAVAGGSWRTVANVRVRANGTFVWPYRFRFVERNALFSFRAVLRRTPGWPWATATGKRVKVRVDVPR